MLRLQITNRFKLFILTNALVMGTIPNLAGCESKKVTAQVSSGSAEVLLQALSLAEVASVDITITRPSIFSPMVLPMFKLGEIWTVLAGGLPAGSNYTFTVSARDAGGATIYGGVATGITITRGQTITLVITAQAKVQPTPFTNAVPVIDSLTVASINVAEGDVVAIKVTAHDPNPADGITYSWSATCGNVSAPGLASTHWTAPDTTGSCILIVEVSDNFGTSTHALVTINVATGNGRGNAKITTTLNDTPVLSRIVSSVGYLVPGSTTMLSAMAADPQGDTMTYAWTSTCAGTFSDSTSSPTFTLDAAAPGAACEIAVVVTDTFGASTNGSLSMPIGAPIINTAPSIESFLQSEDTADFGETVIFSIYAKSQGNGPLYFAWSATGGTIGAQTDTMLGSQVVWTSPDAWAAAWTLTVVATDSAGNSAMMTFMIRGTERWMTRDFHQHTYFSDAGTP